MKITTAVFWVIGDEILYRVGQREYDLSVQKNDFINYDYSHFEVWDEVSLNRYRFADFAAFPRGRLLYKISDKTYYLYIDRCIKGKNIEKLVGLFKLSEGEYKIVYDEHYSCDRCLRNQKGTII